MAAPRLEPHLVMADQSGNIYDDPQLLMVCRRGAQWGLPRPDELMPLPEESELFLLPGRRAVGLNPESGETEVLDQLAVAAFAAPAHTLSAHPAYESETDAPLLPLFAYGAVGFAPARWTKTRASGSSASRAAVLSRTCGACCASTRTIA